MSLSHRRFGTLRADHPVRHGQDGAGTIGTIGTIGSFGFWWRDQFASLLDVLPAPGSKKD